MLEVLLALLVISLTSVALLSGYATTIAGSATHQNLAGLDVVLRDAAEEVTYQVQAQASPDYSPCATTSGTVKDGASGLSGALQYGTSTLDLSGVAFSPGESLSLGATKYWDPSTTNPSSGTSGTWVSTCPATYQDGAQLLTLNALGPHGVAESVQIAVIDLVGASS